MRWTDYETMCPGFFKRLIWLDYASEKATKNRGSHESETKVFE